jgi:hypothetical protein
MSKKHYQAMAESIAAHNAVQKMKAKLGYKPHELKPFEQAHLEVIASVLKAQNPAFSHEKFFAYIAKQEQK